MVFMFKASSLQWLLGPGYTVRKETRPKRFARLFESEYGQILLLLGSLETEEPCVTVVLQYDDGSIIRCSKIIKSTGPNPWFGAEMMFDTMDFPEVMEIVRFALKKVVDVQKSGMDNFQFEYDGEWKKVDY